MSPINEEGPPYREPWARDRRDPSRNLCGELRDEVELRREAAIDAAIHDERAGGWPPGPLGSDGKPLKFITMYLDPGEEQDGRYLGLLAPKVDYRTAEDLEARRDEQRLRRA